MTPHTYAFFVFILIIVAGFFISAIYAGYVDRSKQEELEMDCINFVAHDYLHSTNFTEENREYAMHYAVAECYRRMRT